MTPEQHYLHDLETKGFRKDDDQLMAVGHTQRLYDELTTPANHHSWFKRLFRKNENPAGLYLWGGTGRGKTYIVDSFYSCLPFKQKYRTHFHTFMRDIHSRLQQLPKTPDPLRIIAQDLAITFKILCLDEFHVHDIGDAMIMAGLLQAIHQQGITLVATSNIAIDDLYKNGLQREHFMDTIKFLKQHNTELNLGDGTDYRFSILKKNGTYFLDNGNNGDVYLQQQMQAIAPCTPKTHRQIMINNRSIDYRAMADDVIWFDFDAICNTPRADSDYIIIAEQFHTVLLGNIYAMDEQHDNIAKRFIHLIDALYDHKVKCIFSADKPAADLYRGRSLSMAFDRTISRLVEMDTEKYLGQPHLENTADLSA